MTNPFSSTRSRATRTEDDADDEAAAGAVTTDGDEAVGAGASDQARADDPNAHARIVGIRRDGQRQRPMRGRPRAAVQANTGGRAIDKDLLKAVRSAMAICTQSNTQRKGRAVHAMSPSLLFSRQS
jgi:hypothetical protein